mmetsp:Transcript_6573/g.16812  ORF Transcript_6573/g.16812 Transcript_6573/m.16812 type:complete len:197 (-) Transcript_6573:72-662(-)
MSKPTTVKEAIKNFETEKGVVAANEERVLLFAQVPPIEKMDATLSTLKACKHLSLSTNNIEKISSLSGMDNLMVLSLGRNLIKKVENLDGVADTLEELWVSYNLIEKLANIEKLTKLRILFMSNNKIADFKELDKLGEIGALQELLLVGNPIYTEAEDPSTLGCDYRVQVLKRVPSLIKLDGIPVDVDEREAAKAL